MIRGWRRPSQSAISWRRPDQSEAGMGGGGGLGSVCVGVSTSSSQIRRLSLSWDPSITLGAQGVNNNKQHGQRRTRENNRKRKKKLYQVRNNSIHILPWTKEWNRYRILSCILLRHVSAPMLCLCLLSALTSHHQTLQAVITEQGLQIIKIKMYKAVYWN